MARREVLAGLGLAGGGGGVHAERHTQNRLIYLEAIQCHGVGHVSQRVTDVDLGEASHDEQVTGGDLIHLDPLEPIDGKQRAGLALDEATRHARRRKGLHERDLIGFAQRTGLDAPHTEATEVLRGIEVVDDGLQRGIGVTVGGRNSFDDGLEQCREVIGSTGHTHSAHRATLTGNGRHDGKVQVVQMQTSGLGEVKKEVLDLIEHLSGTGVLAIYLVDDHHHRQLSGQRLGQHVAGLRQGSLSGVNEQQDAVDNGQAPLHLATEIGMARGVNDVELVVPPPDGGLLGEDGYATLALLVIGIHDPINLLTTSRHCPGGTQHGIDQGGFPVVNVGDNGEIAQLWLGG